MTTSKQLVTKLNRTAWVALNDLGFKIPYLQRETKATITDTDGWHVSSKLLSNSVVRLEFWVDRFTRSKTDRLWYGLAGLRRSGALGAIEKAARRQLGTSGASLTSDDVEEQKNGARRLRVGLAHDRFGRCIFERYRSYEYLGFFDEAPASEARVEPIVKRLLKFLSIIEVIPLAEEQTTQGLMVDEGASFNSTTLQRKRSAQLLKHARQHFRDADGNLRCAVCRFLTPAGVRREIIQIHHLREIKKFNPQGERKKLTAALKKVLPLCPTCHVIAHATGGKPIPPAQVAALRGLSYKA